VRARAGSPAAPPKVVTLSAPQPCVVCRTPASQAVGGTPLHTGQCLADWTEGYRRCGDHDPKAAVPTAPAASRREGARFQGPAAVVDAALSGDLARFCGSRLDGARFVGRT